MSVTNSPINVSGNSVSIQAEPDADGNLVWNITIITKDGNSITTKGVHNVPKPKPVVTNYAPNFPLVEKTIHTNIIKNLLSECENTRGRENRKVVCKKIMLYIANQALSFTLAHAAFKATVIAKCKEFITENNDFPDLVEVCNDLLLCLGEDMIIPVAPTIPVSTTESVITSTPVITRSPKYDDNEHEDRVALMKRILTDHEDIDSIIDNVMEKYYAWEVTILPTRKLNRYQKMKTFVESGGSNLLPR